MRTLIVAAVLLVAMAPSAQAVYENIQFTPIIVDGQDFAGFYDIREIAIGEPGDDTLIVRILPEDITVSTGTGAAASIDYFFDDPAGNAQRASFRDDGTAGAPYSACLTDGDYGYCTIPYVDIGASIGSSLTGNYAISYAGAAQDYAPGEGGFVPNAVLGTVGDDYVIVGSTVAAGPQVFYENVTTAGLFVNKAATESSDTLFVINWTGPGDVDLELNATVDNGTATIMITDGAGESVFEALVDSTGNATIGVEAAAGNWTVEIQFAQFVGSLTMIATEHVPEETMTTTTSTTTSSTSSTSSTSATNTTTSATNTTTDEPTEESPGVAILAALVVIFVAVRRRS